MWSPPTADRRCPPTSAGLRSWLGRGWPPSGYRRPTAARPGGCDHLPAVHRRRLRGHGGRGPVRAIGRGEVAKVVLARQVDVHHGRRPSTSPHLLRRWHDLEPNCAVFSVPTPDGQFVGASPELLVERTGAPGTAAVPWPAPPTDPRTAAELLPPELLESTKDIGRAPPGGRRPSARPSGPCAPNSTSPRVPTWSTSTTSPTWARRCIGTLAARAATAPSPTPSSWWPPSIPPRPWAACPGTAALALIARLEPEPEGPLRRTGRLCRRPGRRTVDARDPGHDRGRVGGQADRRGGDRRRLRPGVPSWPRPTLKFTAVLRRPGPGPDLRPTAGGPRSRRRRCG